VYVAIFKQISTTVEFVAVSVALVRPVSVANVLPHAIHPLILHALLRQPVAVVGVELMGQSKLITAFTKVAVQAPINITG
jgi:hypothetical protein